jgi:hypothetical protein
MCWRELPSTVVKSPPTNILVWSGDAIIDHTEPLRSWLNDSRSPVVELNAAR